MTSANVILATRQVIQSVLGALAPKRPTRQPVKPMPHAPAATPIAPQPAADTEAAFLASIADLPEAERAEQIQRREWYARLVARQGIADVEWRTQRYQETGDRSYRP